MTAETKDKLLKAQVGQMADRRRDLGRQIEIAPVGYVPKDNHPTLLWPGRVKPDPHDMPQQLILEYLGEYSGLPGWKGMKADEEKMERILKDGNADFRLGNVSSELDIKGLYQYHDEALERLKQEKMLINYEKDEPRLEGIQVVRWLQSVLSLDPNKEEGVFGSVA